MLRNVRHIMFPYGMTRNDDGTWVLFNRNYKPVGLISEDHVDYNDPRHKMKIKGLSRATLAKLDIRGEGLGTQIFFYNDATTPESSASAMSAYLKRLEILIRLEGAR